MRRLRGEQAATTSEYVGVVVLVGMLVGALIVNNPAGLGNVEKCWPSASAAT